MVSSHVAKARSQESAPGAATSRSHSPTSRRTTRATRGCAPLRNSAGQLSRERRERSSDAESADWARIRLEELLALTLSHRGWSIRQLAQRLNRSSSSLLPESGQPRLDLLVGLADALEWPLETVTDHLIGHLDEDTGPCQEPGLPASCEELLGLATESLPQHAARAAQLARTALLLADGAEARLRATELEADAWARLGRWDRTIQTIQRELHGVRDDAGLASADAPAACGDDPARSGHGLLLRLARAYHRSGCWAEGLAISRTLLEERQGTDAGTLALRAEALILKALCTRDRFEFSRSVPEVPAQQALRDAQDAQTLLRWPAVADRSRDLGGAAPCLATMAAAIIIEQQAALGLTCGFAAVAKVLDGLEPWIDVQAAADREALAGAGWWCAIGLSTAARHLAGQRRHQVLAVLSNKADEIASAVGCWSLRERVLRLEFERRSLAAEDGSAAEQWLLDEEDLRQVVGCIGASRRFRPIGLQILRSATLIRDVDQEHGRQAGLAEPEAIGLEETVVDAAPLERASTKAVSSSTASPTVTA